MEEKNTQKSVKEKIKVGIKLFFLIVFIVYGISMLISNNILAGIFSILFAISLTSTFYEKTKLDKVRYIKVVLPIILLCLAGMYMPKTESSINTDANENELNNSVVIKEVTKMTIDESDFEMDIKETKDIKLKIEPEDANIENIEVSASNPNIIKAEKEEDKEQVKLKITPVAEGVTDICIKDKNGVESNKISITIVDNERIEKEKKEAEEAAKAQVEAQAQAQVEAQAKAQAEAQAKAQAEADAQRRAQEATTASASSVSSSTSSSTQTSTPTDNSITVYITPTGECYHYKSTCGGKNSYSTTYNNAIARGLRACKKCVH